MKNIDLIINDDSCDVKFNLEDLKEASVFDTLKKIDSIRRDARQLTDMLKKVDVVVAQQRKLLKEEFDLAKKENETISNREAFYIMFNHSPFNFLSQYECDSTLTYLVKNDEIDFSILTEDNFYKYLDELREVIDKKQKN